MPRLRFSMLVGAAYDFLLGAAILLALKPLAGLLAIPYPQEPFYAHMQGILLWGLALFYAFPAHDIGKNLRNVAGAVAVRFLGGCYLAAYALSGSIAPFFLVFALADLIFAAWHLILLKGEARVGFWRLLCRGETS